MGITDISLILAIATLILSVATIISEWKNRHR